MILLFQLRRELAVKIVYYGTVLAMLWDFLWWPCLTYLTEVKQFRGLSPTPQFLPQLFWFCLCSQLHIFFCLVFSRYRLKEFKDHPKSSLKGNNWSTLSHSTSVSSSEIAGKQYVSGTKTGGQPCSAHALLLIDAYIPMTIWPLAHCLLMVLFVTSTSLLIVSFSLEILSKHGADFAETQAPSITSNQCIPGWLWDISNLL